MKRKWLFQALYYVLVPCVFAAFLMLANLLLGDSANLGTVIAYVYFVLFLLTPIVAAVLMRFSLLKWVLDPFAALEIPLLLYIGMICKCMTRDGVGILSAFNLTNAKLADDGGEGFVFFAVLFVFSLLCTLSFKRTRECSVSYRILKKLGAK